MIAEVLGGQQKELLIYDGRSPWTGQQKEDVHSLLADLGQNNRRKMFIHCWQSSLDRTTEGICSSTDGRSPWTGQQKEHVHSLLADLGQNKRRKMFIH